EGGGGRGVGGPALGQDDYLAQLRPGDVVAGAVFEAVGAAGVAGDDGVVVGGLYEGVEGVGGGHILEGRRGGCVNSPALGQHHDLGGLAAGGEVVGAEGSVVVAGDDPIAVEVAHRLVEVGVGVHVGEGDYARRAGVQQHRYVVREKVSRGEVDITIPVEVAHRYRGWASAHRKVGSWSKAARAIAQQD